jgi:hypothetical protein
MQEAQAVLAGAEIFHGVEAGRLTALSDQSNRYDPLIPWAGAHRLALDWCAQRADVEFWTNEQPAFLNKTSINHLLPYFVDGERGMQSVADRFIRLPTTPNCGQI